MISQLHIRNFRSIQSADLNLGKITVLTGANNSGKSSFIYALLALKNIVNNPNQSIDNFLNLPFINLGGFEQAVFNKNNELPIVVGCNALMHEFEVDYRISFSPNSSHISLSILQPIEDSYGLSVSFPYPANKKLNVKINGKTAEYEWNGFTAQDTDRTPLDTLPMLIHHLGPFNLPVKTISEIDFVPLRRGFTKPYYGNVILQADIATEDEIATLLAVDQYLANRVAVYLEKIVDRKFSVFKIPDISSFYLQTKDNKTGFIADLVNEGLGTNQLVTILAKVLQLKNKFICIDEPEIHLHPSIIDRLVSVMIEIAEQEGKQFLISTHSEHFITALLNSVVKKEISNNDVKVYYLTKDGKETKAEEQAINEKGQIEGGLKNFYASELDNLKTLFNIA